MDEETAHRQEYEETADTEEEEETTNAGLDDETPLLGDILLPPVPTLDQDGDEHPSTEATVLTVPAGTSFMLPVGKASTQLFG